MAVAAYRTKIFKSGTPTAFTGQGMTNVSGNTWEITNSAMSVWDPTVTPTFYENGVAVPSSDIQSIDWLFGRVTFTRSVATPVTVDGTYLPMQQVANAVSFGITLGRVELDHTTLGQADDVRHRVVGLKEISATMRSFHDISSDFPDLLFSGTPFVVEFLLDPNVPDTSTLRAWMYLTGHNLGATVEELETAELTLTSGAYDNASYAWKN